jgi:DNA-binding PadR family transcriptional regulator
MKWEWFDRYRYIGYAHNMNRHERHHHMRGHEGFGGPHGRGHFGGPGGRTRRRMRRGDVRAAILLLVEEHPRNGYQVMQEIEERSEGAWRPSPGSVYPALQLLADEGLVRAESGEGGNIFELTEAGRSHVEEHRERLGSPWQLAGEGVPEGVRELGKLMMQVGIAVKQVMHAGGETQSAEAAKILAETRRSLYRILAEDEPA